MKKTSLIFIIALLPLLARAQGWPAGYGGVMLQGFFWDSYLENPDFGPNGTQQQRDLGHISMVPHTNPWGADVLHTWATMYGAGWASGSEDWEVPLTSWVNLERVKDKVAPFIDLLWLPQSGATIAPPYIAFGGSSVQTREMRNGNYWNFNPGDIISNPDANGFVPYLWFDHGRGENYTYTSNGITQNYTSMTYFGTEDELKSMIAAYKAMGTGAIEDVVINHKGFAGDFWFQENYTDPTTGSPTGTNWTKADLVGLIYRNGSWTDWYMPLDGSSQEKQITGGGTGRDDGNYGGWANEVAHTSENAQRNTINYLKYLKDVLGYEGFRYDYAAGLAPGRFAQYNMATTPTFSVGEFWTDTPASTWIKNTAVDGTIRSAAFDFQLMYTIKNCFNSGYFQDLKDAGMLNDNLLKRYAVNFIANHDTNKNLPTDTSNPDYANRTSNNVLEANAYLLAMPGTPCLFWAHFMHPGWHDDICRMILARRAAGVTNQANIESAGNVGSNGVWWTVSGTKGKLLLQLGSDAVAQGYDASQFTQVFKSGVCRLCVSNDVATTVDFNDIYNNTKPQLINGYAVIDKPSGSYNSSVTVNVRPSSEGCTLVYSTNGSDPTASSKQITAADGINLTFEETTDLRVGVLLDGQVADGSVVRASYVIGSDQATSGQIKVYVYDPTGATPYIYAWNGDNQDEQYTGSFPGWPMNYTKQIGGITWREATIPASKFNMILSQGGGSTQTHNINNVDHEVFYTFRNGIATDVTATYVKALHDPFVSIDKASGRYSGNLTVTLTTSVEGATIVYTIGDASNPAVAPTASSAQTTGGTITFDTDGTHQLRAAILKDGNVINEVARTYFVTGATGNRINVYVKNMTTAEAPHIYAWDDNQNALTGTWAQRGTTLTETVTNCGQTWYKHTFERSAVNLLFMLTGDKDKTANIAITAPGDYYYYYYPGAHFGNSAFQDGFIDVTSNSKHTTSTKAITVFMYDNANEWSSFLKLYTYYNNNPIYWDWSNSWAESGFPSTSVNGQNWYYCTFLGKENISAILFNGNNDSERFTVTNTTSDVFIRFPSNGNNWNTGDNLTASYGQYLPATETPTEQQGGSTTDSSIPSCATHVPDVQYIYFENTTSMATPCIWAWNSSKNVSGFSWPGDQLAELVGISPEGHAIYRWVSNSGDIPTSLIFSDNGANATSQMTFVNGGYYTPDGLRGTVNSDVTSLAGLIKSGDTSKEFIISNDLAFVFGAGNAMWVKDLDGDAINPSTIKSTQCDYPGTASYNRQRGGDFDQSNWAQLIAPANVPTSQLNHPLLGQTIIGRLTDAVNPTVQLTVLPIFADKAHTYVPNNYIPSNFVEQTDFFFVKPKPQEYANVVWATYVNATGDREFVFSVPAKGTRDGRDAVINAEDLEGAIYVTLNEAYNGSAPAFTTGTMYELTGIIKKLAGGNNAPRHIQAKGGTPSAEYGLSLVSWSEEGNLIITAVEDLTQTVNREVASVRYVNMAGLMSDRPFQGVNIVVTRYTDGTTATTKEIR
ncbi:MAG: starch-binding protein [Muribaculaceae bacterium]|nr:starch-binding protein [Muribaculaceae bacterium]